MARINTNTNTVHTNHTNIGSWSYNPRFRVIGNEPMFVSTNIEGRFHNSEELEDYRTWRERDSKRKIENLKRFL